LKLPKIKGSRGGSMLPELNIKKVNSGSNSNLALASGGPQGLQRDPSVGG